MKTVSEEKLQQLISSYYQRTLTADEQEMLFDGLEQSPELRETFMEEARDEWLIQHAYHVQKAKTIVMHPHHLRQRRKRIQQIAAGVAVLLTLGIIHVARITQIRTAASAIPVSARQVAEVVDYYVMDGDAVSLVNEGKARELSLDSVLYSGDRVLVPSGARLTFKYLNEDTVVEVGANSLFTLRDSGEGKHIRLKSGSLAASVSKQPEGKPMKVITDSAEAVVLGTSFEIHAREFTQLAVHTGRVRFNTFRDKGSIDVAGGYMANSYGKGILKSQPFSIISLIPVEDKTINWARSEKHLIVDEVRDLSALMKFDLGDIGDQIINARLQLRVKNTIDKWGEGMVRLFSVPSESGFDVIPPEDERVQLTHFQGRVDQDMILEMDINPSGLKNGINSLLLTIDEGGNDIWFASSKSEVPPQLILTIRER